MRLILCAFPPPCLDLSFRSFTLLDGYRARVYVIVLMTVGWLRAPRRYPEMPCRNPLLRRRETGNQCFRPKSAASVDVTIRRCYKENSGPTGFTQGLVPVGQNDLDSAFKRCIEHAAFFMVSEAGDDTHVGRWTR